MLISEAQANLTNFATQFSNGNTDLAKGIEAQHKIALALYKQSKELPLEMNLGMCISYSITYSTNGIGSRTRILRAHSI